MSHISVSKSEKCGFCNKGFNKRSQTIACDSCNSLIHHACYPTKVIKPAEFKEKQEAGETFPYTCTICSVNAASVPSPDSNRMPTVSLRKRPREELQDCAATGRVAPLLLKRNKDEYYVAKPNQAASLMPVAGSSQRAAGTSEPVTGRSDSASGTLVPVTRPLDSNTGALVPVAGRLDSSTGALLTSAGSSHRTNGALVPVAGPSTSSPNRPNYLNFSAAVEVFLSPASADTNGMPASLTLRITPTGDHGSSSILIAITPEEFRTTEAAFGPRFSNRIEGATGRAPSPLAAIDFTPERATTVLNLSNREPSPAIVQRNTVLPRRPRPNDSLNPALLVLPPPTGPLPPPQLRFDWSIEEEVLKKGGDGLYDGIGNKYSIHGKVKSKVDRYTKELTATYSHWRCTSRDATKDCYGRALKKEQPPGSESTYLIVTPHTCAPDPYIRMKDLLYREGKRRGRQNIEKSGMDVLQPLLVEYHEKYPDAKIPKPTSFEKYINVNRVPDRPILPQNLNFLIDALKTGFPKKDDGEQSFYRDEVDFYVGDIRHRHLIFATDDQLALLRQIPVWYLDGTYKSCSDPFRQIWAIHGFIQVDELIKQVPLVFVLMSHQTDDDYFHVLEKLKEILEKFDGKDEPFPVEEVVCDFEVAVFNAVRMYFVGKDFLRNEEDDEKENPKVKIHGCAFHWAQVSLVVLELIGIKVLSPEYRKNPDFKKKCREVLALHLLPRNKIKIEFERLRREARDKHLGLEMLFQYIENNWIKKKCWRPVRWANYFRFIRTNNDTEGWHRRLNEKFKSKPNIFKLVFALLEESNYIRVLLRLLEQGDDLRRQRPATLKSNADLLVWWQRYKDHDINPQQLLEGCVEVYFRVFRDDFRTFGEENGEENAQDRESQLNLFIDMYEE